MSSTKVAVVTGSNKGIGYAIVKGLCEKFDGKVYLTARDEGRGIEAVNKLKELGLNPVFHQLDINSRTSIDKFRDFILATDGGIDVLVNNASIAYKMNDTTPLSEQAENTVAVNYFSTLRVCETLFPILRPNAQVIHISSSLGHLFKIPGPKIRSKLSDPKLTITELSELMEQFVNDVKEGKNEERGWGNSTYAISKAGQSALAILQQRQVDADNKKKNISVNHVHPGYVATDMSNFKGVHTVEEGARSTLFLALEPHGLKGQYVWRDCTVADWFGSELPTPF